MVTLRSSTTLECHFSGRRLEIRNRRVSPTSLRASKHHRARWHIKLLSFCPESWEYLIDTCPASNCGKPLRWGRCIEVDRCENCQFDLKEFEAAKVPSDLRGALSFVGDLLHPEPQVRGEAIRRLPHPLNDLPDNEVFDLLCVLTRATMPADLNLTSASFDAFYLSRAAKMLLGYPDAFDRFAADEAKQLSGDVLPLFRRLRRRAREKSRLQRSLIQSLMERAELVHTRSIGSTELQPETGAWSYHRSANWLGLNVAEFRKLIDAGIVLIA